MLKGMINMFGNKAKKEDYNFTYLKRGNKYDILGLYNQDECELLYKHGSIKDLAELDYMHEIHQMEYGLGGLPLKACFVVQSNTYEQNRTSIPPYFVNMESILGKPHSPDFRYDYIEDPEKCPNPVEKKKYQVISDRLSFCEGLLMLYMETPVKEEDFPKLDPLVRYEKYLTYYRKKDYVDGIIMRDIAERNPYRTEFRKRYYLWLKDFYITIWNWEKEHLSDEEVLKIESNPNPDIYGTYKDYLSEFDKMYPIYHEDPKFNKLIEDKHYDHPEEWGHVFEAEHKAEKYMKKAAKQTLKTGNKHGEWDGYNPDTALNLEDFEVL